MALCAFGADLDLVRVGGCRTGGDANGVAVADHYAYVADGTNGLQVIDISNPANPQRVGGYISSNALYVAVSGRYAFVANQDNYGITRGYLDVLDVSNPANPQLVRTLGLFAQPGSMAASSNYVCVGGYWAGIAIMDIRSPEVPSGTVTYQTGSTWGIALQGRYLYIARVGGMDIVDLIDPANPKLVGTCADIGLAEGVAVSGNYAYLIECYSGLNVIDVSNPANPQRVVQYAFSSPVYNPVDVSVNGGYVYVRDGDYLLEAIDVSDPINPRRAGASHDPGVGHFAVSGGYACAVNGRGGLEVIHLRQPANPQRIGSSRNGGGYNVAVSGNYAYVAGYSGLKVLSVSNLSNPQVVGQYTIDGEAYDVALSGHYAYLADALGLQIIDVAEPANPLWAGQYTNCRYPISVAVFGNYACLGDTTNLQVIDISSPANPQQVGSFGSGGGPRDILIADHYAYLAYSSNLVIDLANPANPQPVGLYSSNRYSGGVAVSGSYAYLAIDSGLQIIDLSDPAHPQWLSSYILTNAIGPSRAVAVSGNYAYLGTERNGLLVIDVSDPANPQCVGGNSAIAGIWGITINADKLFVATQGQGLCILNLCTPLSGPALSFASTPHWDQTAYHLSVDGLPGLPVKIERSTDLLNWQTWSNCVLGTSPLELLDSNPVTPHQFYRALSR